MKQLRKPVLIIALTLGLAACAQSPSPGGPIPVIPVPENGQF